MKKLIALLLCLVMVVSVFAGCQEAGQNDGTTTAPTTGKNDPTPSDPTPSETNPPAVLADPEEIGYTPLYKLTFDDSTNLTVVAQDRDNVLHPDANTDGVCDYDPDCPNDALHLDGATYPIVPSDSALLFSNGPVGQCVYLDGNHGLKLENLVAPTDDSYTISFWVNASRLSDFMPSLQIGRYIGGAGDDETVSWINVTQTNFFGTGASFPTVWNRNSSIGPDTDGDGVSNGVWPWANKLDDTVYGKGEWIMVTIVSTGEAYEHVDATTGVAEPRIAAKYYLNGVLAMDANATNMTYHGLSPEILKGEGLEGYLGINYWDYTMKGFFDELYIYDEALTAGQVATLWLEGDASVETEVPSDAPVVEDPTAPVDPNAIDVVGTPDMLTGFWADWSKSWELADGATLTMKLNNYTLGANNWNNFALVLANVATPGHTAPAGVEGYAEYAVVRGDNWGWAGAAGGTFVGTKIDDAGNEVGNMTMSWTDWAAWLEVMKDAEVEVVLTRTEGTISVSMTFTGADGTVMTETGTILTDIAADAGVHAFLICDGCYVEILSVE